MIDVTLDDRYHILRLVGEGGMGTVYEAEHRGIGKRVAVKVLRAGGRVEQGMRLVREARLASAIRHEHIIDVTDSGTTPDGRAYFVMEMLDGESLAERLQRTGRLPERVAVEIVRQAASALEATHARGIVHRDIKSENLFLLARRDGEFVKLLDFGLSKQMQRPTSGEDAQTPSVQNLVVGTPHYMAPEQARGDDDIDHRVDIYALGVILFECLTGVAPYAGERAIDLLRQAMEGNVPSLRERCPEVEASPEVERIVRRAMAADRDDRYATMSELLEDLRRLVAGEKLQFEEEPQRRPYATIAAAVGASAVAIGWLLYLAWPERPMIVTPPPVMVTTPAEPTPLPQTVVLHVETTPPGAEIRDGARVFGTTPKDLIVPRAAQPMKLTFHLDGYEVGSAQVTPTADDAIIARLEPKKKLAGKGKTKPTATSATPTATSTKPTETLPNPY